MGPLMIDVHGTSLTPEDKEILAHPHVGGLILFSRNFESLEQLSELCNEIRHVAGSNILLAVDHEGGRVQRFREGFTSIPAMAKLWQQANGDMALACQYATHAGFVMASEVQAVGIDISFAPVLDIFGISEVIGDRAFHQDGLKVVELAGAFVDGMHLAGMKSTGKHFPGHGSVLEDSHIALPIDRRSREVIEQIDMVVFTRLFEQQKIDAVMPAHVIYPEFDSLAVGFSPLWLQEILRKQLNFDGVIFSDDLTMTGAKSVGGIVERAEAAWQAGCDMLLICNSREDTVIAIDSASLPEKVESQERLQRLLKPTISSLTELKTNQQWQQSQQLINRVFN